MTVGGVARPRESPILVVMFSVRRAAEFYTEREYIVDDWVGRERQPTLFDGDYNDIHQVRVAFTLYNIYYSLTLIRIFTLSLIP